MKYWWLEKYQNLEVKKLPELFSDIQYFLIVPKNYIQIYKKIENLEISNLSEEEMCIILYRISITKNVKNCKLHQIIHQLLLIPDTSLPISDYTLAEMIEEIKGLKEKKAILEKIQFNNIAACYHCLNIFYVDRIQSINKKGECLCPFCRKNKLYYDNELIPMNYSFLFHSKMYYGISDLGCNFSKIQKILKKGIIITNSNKMNSLKGKEFYRYLKKYEKKVIPSKEESKIIKAIYDILLLYEKKGDYQGVLEINWEGNKNLFEISYLLILSCAFALGNFFYLKQIFLVVRNENLKKEIEKNLKQMIKKSYKKLQYN